MHLSLLIVHNLLRTTYNCWLITGCSLVSYHYLLPSTSSPLTTDHSYRLPTTGSLSNDCVLPIPLKRRLRRWRRRAANSLQVLGSGPNYTTAQSALADGEELLVRGRDVDSVTMSRSPPPPPPPSEGEGEDDSAMSTAATSSGHRRERSRLETSLSFLRAGA